MRRPLLIGGTGQVAEAMIEALDREVATTSRRDEAHPIDLATLTTDDAMRLIDRIEPTVVFLTAAFSWVDGCERDPERAFRVNASAPAALGAAAATRGVPLVFFSSDYVFDGQAGPYAESDSPAPINAYGRSKLAGEEGVLAAAASHLVLRTTVVWGPESAGKNFAYRVGRELSAGGRLVAPNDQLGTPTYNRDLAAAAVSLAEAGATGIVHVAGTEWMARDVFATRLAIAAGLTPRVDGCPTADLGPGHAPRPLRAGLVSELHHPVHLAHRWRPIEAAVADWLANPRGLPWPEAS